MIISRCAAFTFPNTPLSLWKDEITRLILDDHDKTAFSDYFSSDVRVFSRDWLLSDLGEPVDVHHNESVQASPPKWRQRE